MSESEQHPPPREPIPSHRLEYARPAGRSEKRKPTIVPNVIAWPIIVACLLVGLYALVYEGNYSRPAANRVHSASNLKQIGLAMIMYANDHRGQYPDSFSTILANEDLTPDVFVSPASNDTPAQGPTTRAVLSNLAKPGHCSYVYFGAGLSDTCDPDTVLACEAPGAWSGAGMNVLFLDGHVDFIGQPAAQQLRAALASGCFVVITSGSIITRPTTRP